MNHIFILLLTFATLILNSLSVIAAPVNKIGTSDEFNTITAQELSNAGSPNSQAKNVKDCGAKGDGIADDTLAVQMALNQNDHVEIPNGIYLINVDTPLKPHSDQTITMSENAVLKAIPTSTGYNAVIRIEGTNNISIIGGEIVGERDKHQGTEGEWGMGITILNGSNNIVIRNITIRDFWGDGIYLGGKPAVSNVIIDNVVSDNNRRQGISITNAKNIFINNCIFSNTNGAAPEAGVDIEPNKNEIAENINISNTQFWQNNGSGIHLMGIAGKIRYVEVIDCTVKDNSGNGLKLVNANNLTLSNTTFTNNKYERYVSSEVNLLDKTISNFKVIQVCFLNIIENVN